MFVPFNQHKSPEVVTSPFSKTKGREEVDNDDEVIQKKPPKAKAVSKQAATRKRSSSKSSKVWFGEEETGQC